MSSISTQTSTLQTTVTGPGTLTFWWYAPFDVNPRTFSFTANNVTQATYPNSGLWQQQTIYLGSGTQTLKWINAGGSGFGGAVYVDQVSYTAGATAPIITTQPFSQSQWPGLNVTFALPAVGTPPLSYQWQFNGPNIPGATNVSFTVTNLQPTNLGIYRVTVTNSVGLLVSSNASLEFGQATAWSLPGYGRTSIPPGASNALAVSASLYHSLLVKADGTVLACGDTYDYGQLTFPANLTNAISVAAGLYSSVVLKADGKVVVFGDNFNGQTNVPTSLSNVVAIASGWTHGLALRADSTVVSWGSNSFGETNVPAGLTNVVAIAAGNNHSLALKADGSVASWGRGFEGQTNVPPSLTNAVAIAGGVAHSLALEHCQK